ncbi:MAG: carboxymuconolactone decarboxylase family protein, partial [Acidimicrobiales bacterium]
MTPSSGPPRIAPLPEDERDDRARDLLAPTVVNGAEMNIFTTLVRHPGLFQRWSNFGGYLLYRGKLPARARELLILRTAFNCRADYEWGQHVRIALGAGVAEAEIARVAEGPDAHGWSPADAALLRAADEMHRDARITETTWRVLAPGYD